MESGYTRPQKERLRKRKLKQALASQAKARAPGKKGMHGSTKELLAKVQGKPLGREMLEWTSIRLMQAAQYYWPLTADGQPKFRAVEAKDRSGQPILDANGKPTFNQVPVGDIDKFMEIAAALSLTSFRLARFQSPTAAGHRGAAASAASAIVAADPLQGAYSECGGRAPDDDHRRRGGRRRRARYEVD